MSYNVKWEVDQLLLSGGAGALVAFCFQWISSWLNAQIPWKKSEGLRLLTGIFIDLIVGCFIVFSLLFTYLNLVLNVLNIFIKFQDIFLKIGIVFLFISLIYNIVYFAIHSYYDYTSGQLAMLRFERQQTELQLKALKSQLSPHFLFNSMNTISSLIEKDVQKAETFIRALAHSYQYTLDTYNEPLVFLKDELTFVSSYCFLLKTRFGDQFTIDIKLPNDIKETKIPPLTLQMLVENAVKHNQIGVSNVLQVVILYNQGKITISNNKTAEPKYVTSFKIGLENIASRYKLLAQQPIEVYNQERFIVNLPVIS